MLSRNVNPHIEPTQHLRQQISVGKRTFQIEQSVKITRLKGNFKIVQIRDDDSVTVYGGANGHRMFRTFTADRLKNAK